MMRTRLLLVFPALAALCLLAVAAFAQDVPRITKDELRARLGNESVVLLDVRKGSDWKGSDLKIQGAVRPNVDKDVKEWAKDMPKDKEYVLYCA